MQVPPAPRTTLQRFSVSILYTAFLTSLLYLFISHSNIDAPMRNHPDEFTFFTESQKQLTRADADPRPSEMHFKMTDPSLVSIDLAKRYMRTYYMAQYIRCPHRLFVGSDDGIINDQPQLLAADKLPTENWLKQRGIGSVYYVSNTDLLGPQVDVIPIH